MREFQQLSLIKRKAELQSRVEGRDITLEEARDWRMRDYICIHFEVCTPPQSSTSLCNQGDMASVKPYSANVQLSSPTFLFISAFEVLREVSGLSLITSASIWRVYLQTQSQRPNHIQIFMQDVLLA